MSDQILGVINPVIGLIFMIGSFLIWRCDTSQHYLFGLMLAPLAYSGSFALNHYGIFENAMVLRMTSSALAFIAVIAVVSSTCIRLRKKPPILVWGAGGILTLVLMAQADPAIDITPWLFLVNGFSALVFATGAQLLNEAKSSDVIDRATVWVFVLIAAHLFVRPAVVQLVEGPMSSEAYRASNGHAVYIVVGAISMILLAGVLIGSAVVDWIKALKDDAQTDSLSGLIARDAFIEQAEDFFANAQEEEASASLIVADIDNFKKINDLWGHAAGDQAIASFGDVFLRTVRSTDLVGRIGGEEFCVLVWNCSEQSAVQLAERLRVRFACEEHEALGPDIRVTASFGVTAWRPGESYHEAFERADAALYEAKNGGRNRVMGTEKTAGDDSTGRASGACASKAEDPAQIVAQGAFC